jgi:hypothetical protein
VATATALALLLSAFLWMSEGTVQWVDLNGHNRGIYLEVDFFADWKISVSRWKWVRHWVPYWGWMAHQ